MVGSYAGKPWWLNRNGMVVKGRVDMSWSMRLLKMMWWLRRIVAKKFGNHQHR